MKIIFISTLDSLGGGSEVLWQQTSKKLLADGHDVTVAVYETMTQSDNIKELSTLGAKVIKIKSWATIKDRSIPVRLLYALKRKLVPSFNIKQILKEDADLFFINQPATYEGFFYPDFQILFKKLKGQYMLLTHGDVEHRVLTSWQIKTAKECFHGAKQTLFVSHRSVNNCQHQLATELNNWKIIDNPLNLSEKSITNYPSLESTINFAQVGRLDASCKGQDLLIAALSTTKWLNRNWILNLYGQGNDEEYLKQLVVFYKLEDRIIFHGHVSDIRKVWEENHILIMPSFAEGKPISLAEAMICGRPAIVTDVAGNSELIIEGETGYIIPAPTKSLIAQGIERAWNDKNNWQNLGKNAHSYASKVYDLDPINSLSKIILNVKKNNPILQPK